MNYRFLSCLIFLALALQSNCADAKDDGDSLRMHTDFPALGGDKKLQQLVYYVSDFPFVASLRMECYRYKSDADSTLVLSKHSLEVAIRKGANKLKVDFGTEDTNTKYSRPYFEVVKRTGCVAPGAYKTFIFATDTHSHRRYEFQFSQQADSILKPGSPLRGEVNKSLAPKSKSFLGMRLKSNVDKVKGYGAGNAIANADRKIGKAAKRRGLRHVSYESGGKSYIDFYYEDWFAGRYEVAKGKSLSEQLKQEEGRAGNASLVPANDLNSHPSMFSQFKSFNKQKDDNQEIKGEISLTTNVSNGQEQYSAVDNNYFELRGRMEMPICNLPFELEGLYTSQDADRPIKSSYFHLHYDVSKSKDALKQMIGSYNQKFGETQAKGAGMEQVYQKAIGSMEGQKSRLAAEIKAQEGTKDAGGGTKLVGGLEQQARDTSGLGKTVSGGADSGSAAGRSVGAGESAKSTVSSDTGEIDAKRRQIEALDRKIEKYKALLGQNRNTNYFDSTMGYSKTKNFNYSDESSYRQLTRSGENLLPDGTAKKFATGITTMDAGMFPKNDSRYTTAGQMVKGVDFGYDLGVCETGATVGKTQYVGRDGSLDKYTCYSGKIFLKPIHKQKVGFIYYGYSQDHNMLSGDAFFSKANVSAPSFFQPVSIVSADYKGSISQFVTLNGEVATSLGKVQVAEGQSPPTQGDKLAWHFSSDGSIPNTTVKLEASYDKTGKDFVNNTLPVSLSGTQQYKLSGSSDFFRSVLTVGIEYDYLTQSSFAATGSSTRWGFSIKTHSKRYPTLSVSYKPFTTFRAYTDTLNIPQRPLLGSVWTSKASYKFKKDGKSYIFSLLYNRCVTAMDTATYGSTLMQAMCTYAEQKTTALLSAGYMGQTGQNTTTVATAPNAMDFVSMSVNYTFSKAYSLTGGQDFGIAPFGFCRYSVNSGVICNFLKKPMTLRFNLRYSTYELNSGESWKQLYSGSVELGYRFKSKVPKKNNF